MSFGHIRYGTHGLGRPYCNIHRGTTPSWGQWSMEPAGHLGYYAHSSQSHHPLERLECLKPEIFRHLDARLQVSQA